MDKKQDRFRGWPLSPAPGTVPRAPIGQRAIQLAREKRRCARNACRPASRKTCNHCTLSSLRPPARAAGLIAAMPEGYIATPPEQGVFVHAPETILPELVREIARAGEHYRISAMSLKSFCLGCLSHSA